MIIAYTDQNELNWGIKLLDDSKAELAQNLMSEGMEAWYAAADAPNCEPTEHFTAEEVASYEQSGYAEPACELLDRFHLPYEEIKELDYDEDENVMCDVLI